MNELIIVDFFSSSLFSNICTFLSAIGTLAAVIVSLYLSEKNEKIKYKITRSYTIPIGFVGNFLQNYYSISLINKSRYMDIHIESMPYIKQQKMNLAITTNIDWEGSNELPKTIKYGQKYTITLDKKVVANLLNMVDGNNITIVFKDTLGNMYKHKIKRKELEIFIKN